MHTRLLRPLFAFAICAGLLQATSRHAAAAEPPPDDNTTAAPAASVAVAQDDDDDATLDLAEPDFRIINLPTTLRLPKYKGNFSLTHRFGGNLRKGSFSDQASSLFGIDEGATVGFEYRFAVAKHLEAVAYRVSFQRTIQLSAKYDALHQSGSLPLSLSLVASDEGVDNFHNNYAPAFGATVSRKVGDVVAVYAVPMWVHNSAANAGGAVQDTTFIGIGGRVRLRPTVYVSAEVSPRVSGYKPGSNEYGFGLEKRAGGHLFQLNFTNTFGSTFAQVARGGSPESLSLGFNLIRKFY